MLSNFWDGVKVFFKRSETVFLARLETITGVVIAGVGAMDWSPLLSLNIQSGIDSTVVMWLGGISAAKGIVTEWARRRNDPVLALNAGDDTKENIAAAKKSAKQTITKVTKEEKK